MTVRAEFICPRCAHICTHALEIAFGWCPVCRAYTGPEGAPRLVPPPPPLPESTRREIMIAQDDCLIAMENRKPVPVAKLQALPPWRAVALARIADQAGLALERGTVEQIAAEAREVGGDGTLGDWWLREAS